MRRRDFLAAAPAALSAAGQKRNTLLIYVEQFQHDVASFAGGPAKTPHLDKLAAGATHFRTACTSTALCSPARAALFTGRFGHRTGLDDNCYIWHSRLTTLPEKQTTLIEWANRRGYFMGYYGKWHLGKDGPIRRGVHRHPTEGFDRGLTRTPGKSSPRPDFKKNRAYYEKNATFVEKPGFYETDHLPYERTNTGSIAQGGCTFLAEAAKQDGPFFLTLSFNAVHPPYHVPAPYNSMYDPREMQLPANLRDTFVGKPEYQADIMWPFHDTGHLSDDDWRRSIAYYRGYVTMLDRAIGQVIDAVKANGLWDNTAIVVVADHGDMNGAHNRFDKGPYCYDEVMRIPMLVRIPDASPRVVSRHVSSIDINRTLCDWMELQPDAPNVDSRSLLPLIERGDSGWPEADEAYYRYEWYNGIWFGIRAVRTPKYKYCFNPGGIDELYDLERDAGEMRNLAGSPELRPVLQKLQRSLLDHLRQTEDTMLHEKLSDFIG